MNEEQMFASIWKNLSIGVVLVVAIVAFCNVFSGNCAPYPPMIRVEIPEPCLKRLNREAVEALLKPAFEKLPKDHNVTE